MLAAPMPKRLLTTFTSSGCETSLGMGAVPLRSGAAAIAVENAGDVVSGEVVMEIVIHLDGRPPAAGADAFDFFEREQSILGHALVPDAEFFLEALIKVISAAQHATDVGAYLHVVFAGRLEAQ